jgi:hypothetical protein
MSHAEELLQDPTLSQHSHFHAEEKYLHRGHRVMRFYDEPWSGREWWDAEVCKRPWRDPHHFLTHHADLPPLLGVHQELLLAVFGVARQRPGDKSCTNVSGSSASTVA